MERQYFVTIIAPDRAMLQRLRAYDLDVFHATSMATDRRNVALARSRDPATPGRFERTAKVSEVREFVIDGLLSLDEVGRLVDDGYQVLVKENDRKRSRAQTDVIEFPEWLKGMGG